MLPHVLAVLGLALAAGLYGLLASRRRGRGGALPGERCDGCTCDGGACERDAPPPPPDVSRAAARDPR